MPKSSSSSSSVDNLEASANASAINSSAPRFAIASAANCLLLWIITHFLVVSSFRRLERSTGPTTRHKQSRTYRQHLHHNHYHHHHHHQLQHQHHRWLSLIMLLFAPDFFSVRQPPLCQALGYSYARFVGPVSGPEHQIIVPDALNGGTRLDYVARPEYQFAYGVEDSETHVLQNRQETRDGDAVKGVYSVVDPDGTLRVVKYTADDANGFQAQVITDGVATIHGNGAPKANNVANWHYAHGQDGADDDDDDNDGGDGGNKNDYEVYEENTENAESDDASDDGDYDGDYEAAHRDASNAEESYEASQDDGGGYAQSNNSNDDEADDDYY